MTFWQPQTALAALVVCSLVVTGPLTGLDVTEPAPTAFGDGTATVTGVELDADALAVTRGRFGTGVDYLRVPPATVTVGELSGRPRLVYVVTVPELDLEVVATALVTDPYRTYRIAPGDRGLPKGSSAGRYDATVTVRLQSFTDDRIVTRANVTVGDGP